MFVLSQHDIDVIHSMIHVSRAQHAEPVEFHIASRRIAPEVDGLRVFGIPIRRRDGLGLNDGLVIRKGRPPLTFDFEESPHWPIWV